jgi:hypothetical protein
MGVVAGIWKVYRRNGTILVELDAESSKAANRASALVPIVLSLYNRAHFPI